MLAPVLAFCAGAASQQLLPALLPPGALAAALATALACRRRAGVLAAGCCGLVWATLWIATQLAADWPCGRDRETVELSGIVAAPAIPNEGRVDFDFDAESPRPLRLRLAWYGAPVLPEPGQRWSLTARLRCRHGLANPGVPDREFGLLRQGISATGYVAGNRAPLLLGEAAGARPVERLRRRVAAGITRALPDGPSAAVLQGLSVGVRGRIPGELWDAFAATGVAHLMAISGLHVTGCAIGALALLRLARRLPGVTRVAHWIWFESGCVVAVTAAYAWLSGASAPALRTLAMVAIAALLRLSRRHWSLFEALALAAGCLISADPLSVTSAGLWLSFVATATLLALTPEAAGWSGRVAAFARAQIAVLVTLAPVLAAAFGRVSLIAPFANAIAIPLFSLLLLPAVLLGTLLQLGADRAAAPVWRSLAALLDPLWPLLLATARWPLADWAPARQPGVLLATCGMVVFLALLVPLAGLRAAAGAMLVAVLAGSAPRPADGWSLTVLDVGQGLAVVVETRRHVLVFDTGPRWRGGGAAAEVSLLPYLQARGIRRVDGLITSHADLDHAGGVAALAAAMPIATPVACRRGQRWHWDMVQFEVLHPPPGLEASDNDASCALMVQGPGGRALLLADPEAEAESLLQEQPIAADVVLLPHHGSRSSSGPGVVAAVRARLGIASAGFGNRWGMPHAEVVARWRAAGTTVLSTAEAGAVTVRFDRRGLRVATARSERRWWRPAAVP
jgi:competence protein ComEC